MIRTIRGETADENDKAPNQSPEITREDFGLDRDAAFSRLRDGPLREYGFISESDADRCGFRGRLTKRLNRPAGNQNRPSPPNTRNEEPVAPNQLEATAPRVAARQNGQSLEGIRQRGIRSLFTQEEQSLMIPGFVNSMWRF